MLRSIHLAMVKLYRITKNRHTRKHLVKQMILDSKIEFCVDTRIRTSIQVQYKSLDLVLND